MTVSELNRDQMMELKEIYLDQALMETEGRSASYGEIASADELITDGTIYENYEHYDFTEDDFFCSAGN